MINSEGKKGFSVYIIIAVFVVILFAIFGLAIGASAMGLLKWAEPTPSFSGSSSGKACYLKDDKFRDINTITSADEVVNKITDTDLKSAEAKDNIKKIIDSSAAANVNPALTISIWGGEQGFSHPEKAFGCGVYDVDGDRDIDNLFPGFDKQLTCALDKINLAIGNTAPYNKPAGVNTFTRLFYTYTGAMHASYTRNGYVADASNSRIKFLNMLVPDQVTCESGVAGGGINAIVAIAEDEIGYNASPSGGNTNCAKYNPGGACQPWCANFVSWVFTKAGNPMNVPTAIGMETFFAQAPHSFKKAPLSISDLVPGSVVVFDGGGHAGIVEKAEGGVIFTIEGNTSGDVVKRETHRGLDAFQSVGKW